MEKQSVDRRGLLRLCLLGVVVAPAGILAGCAGDGAPHHPQNLSGGNDAGEKNGGGGGGRN